MKKIRKKFQEFLRDDSGATAIEYGLISALMAVAAIASFSALGNGLVNLFGKTNSGAGGEIFSAAGSL